MSTRYIEPPKKKVVTELSEALIRKRKACERISRAYIFNKTADKNILETSILTQKYPHLVKDSLLNVCRVKIFPGTFETNSEGSIDDRYKTQEALVYIIRRQVMDPHNPDTVALRYCTIKDGTYSRPFPKVERNEEGEVSKSEIAFWKHMFWIPFTKENVRKVLEEHNHQYRNLVCAHAVERGDHWHTGTTFNVPNLEELVSVPFDTLVQASKIGVLTSDWGGHVRYLKKVEEDRARLQNDIEEFTSNKKSIKK